MHEFSLVSAVIDTLSDLSACNGWGRVLSVSLRVGAMRQVVPEIMSFAFAAATEGTPFDGTKLVVERVPILIQCPACGKSWGEDQMGMVCPYCGSPDAQMVTGMELDIDSVEVEDDNTEVSHEREEG